MQIQIAAATSLRWDYHSGTSDTESIDNYDSSSISSQNTQEATPVWIQPFSTTHTNHLQHHQNQPIHAQHYVHGSPPNQGRNTPQTKQLHPKQW